MVPVVEHKIVGKKRETQKEIWQKCFECFLKAKAKAKTFHVVHYVIIFVYVLDVEENTLITHLT